MTKLACALCGAWVPRAKLHTGLCPECLKNYETETDLMVLDDTALAPNEKEPIPANRGDDQ